ncbi:MAG TPA: CBU_0585 family protein [Gammaproteobacteria bacterium]|jgi:hypothetical protein|nr:CBU_0585 family protein [Gammaproteobacteria bacterium]
MISLKKLLGLEYYVSPTDKFLLNYDQTHSGISHSQRKEIEKSSKIANLRDHATITAAHADKLWDKF